MKKPEELFKEHFDKFRSGLFKASLDHYLETGTLSGSMLLEVRAMFEAHDKQKLNIASVVRPEVESAKAGELLGNEANEKTVRDGHDPEVVKRMWEAESKYGNRAFE